MKKLIVFTCALFLCAQISAQCFADRHSRVLSDGWQSCEMKENPNAVRGNSHWLMYNFGHDYTFGPVHFWNTNNPDALENGLNEIVIDYSQDGITWTEWGTFEIPKADGSGFYEGTEGPDLTGIHARYLLITGLSNHGGNCFGLGEIRIATQGVSVSSEDEEYHFALDVFPNPSSDIVTIAASSDLLNEIPFSMFDLSGQLMQQGILNSNIPLSINISNWPAGQYQIVIGPKGNESQKSLTVLRE